MDVQLLTLYEFREVVGNCKVLVDSLSDEKRKTFLISLNKNPFTTLFNSPKLFIENIDKSKFNEYFYYTNKDAKKKRIILNQLYLPVIRKNLAFLLKNGFNLN